MSDVQLRYPTDPEAHVASSGSARRADQAKAVADLDNICSEARPRFYSWHRGYLKLDLGEQRISRKHWASVRGRPTAAQLRTTTEHLRRLFEAAYADQLGEARFTALMARVNAYLLHSKGMGSRHFCGFMREFDHAVRNKGAAQTCEPLPRRLALEQAVAEIGDPARVEPALARFLDVDATRVQVLSQGRATVDWQITFDSDERAMVRLHEPVAITSSRQIRKFRTKNLDVTGTSLRQPSVYFVRLNGQAIDSNGLHRVEAAKLHDFVLSNLGADSACSIEILGAQMPGRVDGLRADRYFSGEAAPAARARRLVQDLRPALAQLDARGWSWSRCVAPHNILLADAGRPAQLFVDAMCQEAQADAAGANLRSLGLLLLHAVEPKFDAAGTVDEAAGRGARDLDTLLDDRGRSNPMAAQRLRTALGNDPDLRALLDALYAAGHAKADQVKVELAREALKTFEPRPAPPAPEPVNEDEQKKRDEVSAIKAGVLASLKVVQHMFKNPAETRVLQDSAARKQSGVSAPAVESKPGGVPRPRITAAQALQELLTAKGIAFDASQPEGVAGSGLVYGILQVDGTQRYFIRPGLQDAVLAEQSLLAPAFATLIGSSPWLDSAQPEFIVAVRRPDLPNPSASAIPANQVGDVLRLSGSQNKFTSFELGGVLLHSLPGELLAIQFQAARGVAQGTDASQRAPQVRALARGVLFALRSLNAQTMQWRGALRALNVRYDPASGHVMLLGAGACWPSEAGGVMKLDPRNCRDFALLLLHALTPELSQQQVDDARSQLGDSAAFAGWSDWLATRGDPSAVQGQLQALQHDLDLWNLIGHSFDAGDAAATPAERDEAWRDMCSSPLLHA
jgi:hypothetical protein